MPSTHRAHNTDVRVQTANTCRLLLLETARVLTYATSLAGEPKTRKCAATTHGLWMAIVVIRIDAHTHAPAEFG